MYNFTHHKENNFEQRDEISHYVVIVYCKCDDLSLQWVFLL